MRFLRALVAATLLAVAIRASVIRSKYESYDDSFGRFKMVAFSAAAYADEPNLCLQSALPGGNSSIYNVVEIMCDAAKSDSCRGFTAVAHDEKAIIISFRGTNAFWQLVQEGLETLLDTEEFVGGGKVSKYFYEAFKSVWNGGMKNDYLTLRNKYPSYDVWVTGHSLGGAMASLCSGTLIHEGLVNSHKLVLMTFGQPRVGDKTYADAHNALVPFSYRVVHNRDIVPHVPPEHSPAALFDGYVHHESEVFYENDMKPGSAYTICRQDEGAKCSDSLWVTISITDHLHYFQTKEMFPDFGEDGCPVSYLK